MGLVHRNPSPQTQANHAAKGAGFSWLGFSWLERCSGHISGKKRSATTMELILDGISEYVARS